MAQDIEYRGYRISYDPPPIPTRNCDWQWSHRDYDGEGDPRHGFSPSEQQAKADIDELIEELSDDWRDEGRA